MASLTGTVTKADGTAYTSYVRFSMHSQPQPRGSALVNGDPVDALCNSSGVFTVTLAIGEYWANTRGGKPFRVVLPEDASYNLVDVVVSDAAVGSLFRRFYLFNSTTGLYHAVTLSGTGHTVGTVIDPDIDTVGCTTALRSDPVNVWDSIYVYNPTTGLYHEVGMTGSGISISLTFGVTGTSSPSTGLYSDGLYLWSPDESVYRKLVLSGTGAAIGFVVG